MKPCIRFTFFLGQEVLLLNLVCSYVWSDSLVDIHNVNGPADFKLHRLSLLSSGSASQPLMLPELLFKIINKFTSFIIRMFLMSISDILLLFLNRKKSVSKQAALLLSY